MSAAVSSIWYPISLSVGHFRKLHNAITPSDHCKKNTSCTQCYCGSFVFAFLFGTIYKTNQFVGDRYAWACFPLFSYNDPKA